jgi:23S rRNA (adenine2503-C2)-methyltransferase
VNLAVSLHAARDDLRNELVPINTRYPLADLIASCQDYLAAKRRRVTFEWALIDKVNDTDRDAHELAELCLQLSPSAHVNLIPLNPTPGWPTVGSSPTRVAAFEQLLRKLGVNATTRQNRGTDIAAACGQLAAGQPVVISSKTRQKSQ